MQAIEEAVVAGAGALQEEILVAAAGDDRQRIPTARRLAGRGQRRGGGAARCRIIGVEQLVLSFRAFEEIAYETVVVCGLRHARPERQSSCVGGATEEIVVQRRDITLRRAASVEIILIRSGKGGDHIFFVRTALMLARRAGLAELVGPVVQACLVGRAVQQGTIDRVDVVRFIFLRIQEYRHHVVVAGVVVVLTEIVVKRCLALRIRLAAQQLSIEVLHEDLVAAIARRSCEIADARRHRADGLRIGGDAGGADRIEWRGLGHIAGIARLGRGDLQRVGVEQGPQFERLVANAVIRQP